MQAVDEKPSQQRDRMRTSRTRLGKSVRETWDIGQIEGREFQVATRQLK
jgi:hypothetical protein